VQVPNPFQRGVEMPPEGVRRSSRIPKEIGILLVGSDMEGKMFSEQTKTVVLSRHGAGIVSQYALSAEQELILRRLDTNKEAEVRVVGNLGAHGKTYTYGVAFLHPETDLWEIQFPSMTDSEKEASRVLLQCSGCKACEMVQQSDLESDVYLVNEGIVRTCKRCGSSTFWRRPIDEAGDGPLPLEAAPAEAERNEEPPEAVPLASPDADTAAQPAVRIENRRKHVRTKVSFKACIRSFTFGEDIVLCEDMSRGGLRFKSRKEYAANMEIDVAAPYSPGAQAIFVRAHVVHVMELKNERRFRCGVCYAKS
jgi:PilZ domain